MIWSRTESEADYYYYFFKSAVNERQTITKKNCGKDTAAERGEGEKSKEGKVLKKVR